MKQETIEKAAFKYACEHQIAPATGRELEKGFINGAQWRINSVWHDTSEEPCIGEHIIAIDETGFIAEECYYGRMYGNRWAYVSDLLPERKEETK